MADVLPARTAGRVHVCSDFDRLERVGSAKIHGRKDAGEGKEKAPDVRGRLKSVPQLPHDIAINAFGCFVSVCVHILYYSI